MHLSDFLPGRFCRRSSPTAARSLFFIGMLATGKHFDWKIRCALQHSPGEGIFQLSAVLPDGEQLNCPPPRGAFRQDREPAPVLLLCHFRSILCVIINFVGGFMPVFTGPPRYSPSN